MPLTSLRLNSGTTLFTNARINYSDGMRLNKITNEAVEIAAAFAWSRSGDGTRPEWKLAMEEAQWVDAVEELREETRLILEAASAQIYSDALMSAAEDLAGDTHNSHWDKLRSEFKGHDGERLTPQHDSYLDGVEESREFLYLRAREIRRGSK